MLGAAFAKRNGLSRNAARVFGALARAVPDHPMSHVLLAESLLALQRYRAAKSCLRAGGRARPRVRSRELRAGGGALTEGEYSRAHWEISRAAYHDTRRQGLFRTLYEEYASQERADADA